MAQRNGVPRRGDDGRCNSYGVQFVWGHVVNCEFHGSRPKPGVVKQPPLSPIPRWPRKNRRQTLRIYSSGLAPAKRPLRQTKLSAFPRKPRLPEAEVAPRQPRLPKDQQQLLKRDEQLLAKR